MNNLRSTRHAGTWIGVIAVLLVFRIALTSTYHAAMASVEAFSDFYQAYDGGVRLNEGKPLYGADLTTTWYPKDLYIYPPGVALLFRPIAKLPNMTARHVWIVAMLSTLVASMLVFKSASRLPWSCTSGIIVIILTGCRFIPTMWEFFFGQLDFILLLCVCCIYWAGYRKQLVLVAILIGCAALLKTWMLLFFIWLIFERAWKPLLLGTVVFSAGLALTFACVGFTEFGPFISATLRYANQPAILSHSIAGFAAVIFQPGPHVVAPWIASDALYWIARTAGSLSVLGVLAWSSRSRGVGGQYLLSLRMSLTVVSVLLLLPLCHVTYFILLLPVFWTLLALPHRHIQPPAWILGCTAFVYLTLTCNLACDMSGQHLNSILMAGLRFFSLLFLWMLVVLAVWHELRRLSVAPNRSGHTTEGPMTSVGTIQSTVE